MYILNNIGNQQDAFFILNILNVYTIWHNIPALAFILDALYLPLPIQSLYLLPPLLYGAPYLLSPLLYGELYLISPLQSGALHSLSLLLFGAIYTVLPLLSGAL